MLTLGSFELSEDGIFLEVPPRVPLTLDRAGADAAASKQHTQNEELRSFSRGALTI